VQNSTASSIVHPSTMLPSGLNLFLTYHLKTFINLSKGNIWCRYIGPRALIWSTDEQVDALICRSKSVGNASQTCIESRLSPASAGLAWPLQCLFRDRVEERTQLYDWGTDHVREDTSQGNWEQLSHNDMTVMGLHTTIVKLKFSHVN
jgi:hypothetical protein